ncbi:succinate dehydrogenase, cytochrome b556 subunit [Sphingomonas sp. AOB5]|uniref:succinate dehydrogenase, cytochrome b556 subunit n=1 Tax=Sphingomonas sp. AOB5 TaxID=3034017 RepID=UPI0023F7953A|nr:succinate dehydrogenase, cytochrome b556 subunit [Sphingomonas sp. AOB5]MDF7775833.1 succinate dehydrogenase, cytochrome b556 subunit [Sphingomonas sp. AOB5]
MANVRNEERPLSPHLTIWKWGPGMAVSIVHRVCGSGLATVGTILFVWWLIAMSYGEPAYAKFIDLFTKQSGDLNIVGYVFGIGLTFVLFQHMASGIRHFFLDAGDNFELKANKASAYATFAVSVIATLAFWYVILEKLNG